MKDIQPILQSLGLMDSEIKTYRAAFEHGSGTVIDLAKKTKLSRQAVYVAINALIDRGLLTSSLHGKKRFFAAEHPEKLLAYAQRKNREMQSQIQDLERIVPQLELQMGGEKPVVRVYEGKEGLKAFIEDVKSTECKEAVEMADADALYNVLSPEDLRAMRTELKRRKLRVRGLYTGKLGENITNVNRHILPLQYSGFKSNIGVFGNKIHLISFEGKMHSILIECEPLAKTLTMLFDLAFKGVKK